MDRWEIVDLVKLLVFISTNHTSGKVNSRGCVEDDLGLKTS